MKDLTKLFLMLAATALALGGAVHAQEKPPSEYQLKAAFVYNFAKFIEWPPTSFPDERAAFMIGVIGDNPFDGNLELMVKNKTVNGHPFAVKQVKALSELKTCHVLFISASEQKRLPEILEAIRGASVLTVSETERFLQAGGIINFIMEGNKVRFEINDEAARRAGLRISSKLLNLAKRPERGSAKP